MSNIGPKMRKPITELIGNRVLKDLPMIASDVEQIEQKEEVAPEKQKESLIDKFYKPYKSSAASAWYKA